MTTARFAIRMGVKQPSIISLEQSEARGSIELATLRRAAEALNCTLVYALLPKKSLEATVRERASEFVRRRLEPIEHSMLLEDQMVTERDANARIDQILEETNPRLFWD
jgi:predicted DNA-binding mobile mystery protein A